MITIRVASLNYLHLCALYLEDEPKDLNQAIRRLRR